MKKTNRYHKQIVSVLAALIAILTTSPGSIYAEEGGTPFILNASFWDYESLCKLEAPPDEPLTMRAVTNLKLTLTECARLEKQWGKPPAVRVCFTNMSTDEKEVTLSSISSMTILSLDKSSPQPALGVLLRQPNNSGGSTLSPVEHMNGSLAFLVDGGKAISLIFFFTEVHKGDKLAFGEMTPVAIDGEPPVTILPQDPILKTKVSIWKGGLCDKVPNRPSSMTFKQGFKMESGACTETTGVVTLVSISNEGGKTTTVNLHGLDSIKLKRKAGGIVVSATGFGLTMRNPLGSGIQTNMVKKMEGELCFDISGEETIDFLIMFPNASAGDEVTFGDAPSATIQ